MKSNANKLLLFFLYWIIYSGLISRYIIANPLISFIPDIIVLYLSIKYLIYKEINISIIGRGYKFLIFVLFICSLIGSLLNENTFLAFFWGLRMHLRYLLLFCLAFFFLQKNDIIKYKGVIEKAFFINTFIVAIQCFIQGYSGDTIGGSFTGNLGITLLLILALLFFSFDYFYGKIKLMRYVFAISCSFFIAVVAEIKFLYFFIPIIIVGTYSLTNKISLKYIFIILFCYLFTVPILKSIISLYYDDNYIENIFDAEKLKEYNDISYGFMEGGFNRGTAIQLTNEVILKSTSQKLFGLGLGSGSQAKWTNAPAYNKYYNTTFYYFTTSLALVELGWIGSLAYLCIFILFFYNLYFYFRNKVYIKVKYWTGIGIMGCLTTFVLIYYTAGVYIDYYIFYLFFAMCFKYLKYEKK